MKQLFIGGVLVLSVLLLYSCADSNAKRPIGIIRQFTGHASGVNEAEYVLFRKQNEMVAYLIKRHDEHKDVPPIMDLVNITDEEMCLFIFMGATDSYIGQVFSSVLEEQDRIIFRILAPGCQQIVDPTNLKNTNNTQISNPDTPFGYFVLPRTNKKVVIQNDLSNEIGVYNWQTVKEFNPR